MCVKSRPATSARTPCGSPCSRSGSRLPCGSGSGRARSPRDGRSAVAGRALEDLALVARLTVERLVRRFEGESRCRRVAPCHRRPGDRPMAGLAVGPKLRLEAVVRLADPMAVVAARRRALENALQVTRRARNGEVLSLQREGGGLVEGPRRGAPDHDVVTGRAVAPERAVVEVLMAVSTVDRERVPHGRSMPGREVRRLLPVALGAGDRRVLARKELRGLLPRRVDELLHVERSRPVAGLAALRKLTEVRILVAGPALGRDAREPDRRPLARGERRGRPRVAFRAGNALVPPRQSELRPGVVEEVRPVALRREAVAPRAIGTDLAEVRVLVTGRAFEGDAPVFPRGGGRGEAAPRESSRGSRLGEWHFSQAMPACAPAKNSGRRGCSNVESLNDVVPWHVSQLAPSLPPWGSAWHEAHAAFAPRKSTVRCARGTRACAAAAL